MSITTPTPTPREAPEIRDRILSHPELILDDQDLLSALAKANDRALGTNVVDMRGLAMERLQARFELLEQSRESIIAAVSENLASTTMIHRAVLGLLEAQSLQRFLEDLTGPVAEALPVRSLRLVLERDADDDAPGVDAHLAGLAERGYCCLYAGQLHSGGPRRVTLRAMHEGTLEMHGEAAPRIRSEACLLLDLGPGHPPGMVVLGSDDPDQFAPGQLCDLLDFFAGTVERMLRRWLP